MFSINVNQSKSFNQNISTSLVKLSSQECSEVIISNKTGQGVLVYDNNNFSDAFSFMLSANDVFTFTGVTDSSQISAKTTGGSGVLYYRTKMYSNLPQR